jgi:hypothetical protein
MGHASCLSSVSLSSGSPVPARSDQAGQSRRATRTSRRPPRWGPADHDASTHDQHRLLQRDGRQGVVGRHGTRGDPRHRTHSAESRGQSRHERALPLARWSVRARTEPHRHPARPRIGSTAETAVRRSSRAAQRAKGPGASAAPTSGRVSQSGWVARAGWVSQSGWVQLRREVQYPVGRASPASSCR